MKNIPLIDPPIQSMTLADGRQMTWQEFGVPDGKPVLYFHGGGSQGFEAGIFHREAVERNIRLISTYRPGAGGSTLCPGRPAVSYTDDLSQLLARLTVEKFACLGESNGGMMTLVVAASMSTRVLGAIPINPTVPWFDPVARSVTPGGAALAYRLMKYWPGILATLAGSSSDGWRKRRAALTKSDDVFHSLDLIGPPPGTEQDVAEVHWRIMNDRAGKQALMAELKWASSDWGVDYYAIPVALDFFCGEHDAQGPFARVLADRNANARFHSFPYGHHGFSLPDTRRRLFDTIASYFGS